VSDRERRWVEGKHVLGEKRTVLLHIIDSRTSVRALSTDPRQHNHSIVESLAFRPPRRLEGGAATGPPPLAEAAAAPRVGSSADDIAVYGGLVTVKKICIYKTKD